MSSDGGSPLTLPLQALPTTGDQAVLAMLKVLRMEREREREREKLSGAEEGCNNMADEVGKQQAPVDDVDDAIKVLVRNAIHEFGFDPCDAYNGMLYPSEMRVNRDVAVKNFKYPELMGIVKDQEEGWPEPGVIVVLVGPPFAFGCVEGECHNEKRAE